MPSFGFSDAVLVLTYAAVLIVPGLTVCLAAGLRRWTCAAVSPAVTYGLTALAGQVSTFLNLDFVPITLLGTTVLTTVLVIAFRIAFARFDKRRSSLQSSKCETDDNSSTSIRRSLTITTGILAGALLSAGTVLMAMGRIDAIAQRWDAVFHSSATAFILNTNDADPGALKAVVGYDSAFYPNLYHSLGAVVGHLTGASVPALLGAQLMLVCGVAGLGLAGLVYSQTRSVALAALSPFLLAMFSGFSYDILLWGPVWAFAAGIALIPGFLLLFTDSLEHRTVPIIFVTGVAAVGVLGTHVAAALTAALFLAAFLCYRWWKNRQLILRDLTIGAAALGTACAVGFVYVRGSFASTSSVYEVPWDWPPVASPGAALGNLLTLSQDAPYPQYWLVGLLIVGAFGIKRIRAMWWWFTVTGIFALLYVGAASYNTPLTEALTLPWWNDRYRLAAIVNLGLVPLAAHGLVILGERLVALTKTRVPHLRRLPDRQALAVSLALFLLALGVLSNGFYGPRNADHLASGFSPSPAVTVDEVAAMQVLTDMVGPGEQVMNDPNDGSTWMWPIVGVRPVIGQIVYDYGYENLSVDIRLLLETFRCLDSDSTLRTIVAERNITHVFLGAGYITDRFTRIDGLRGLSEVDSLQLVYDENGIRIYEIDLAPLAAAESTICSSSPT